MALGEYRKKRDPKKTPEPFGNKKKGKAPAAQPPVRDSGPVEAVGGNREVPPDELEQPDPEATMARPPERAETA